MKRVQALITYSLLGSVWLASCGGDNKKTAPPFQEAEGGEAGETAQPGAGAPSAGAGNRAGAESGGAAGEAGQASVAGTPGEGGSGGDASLGGQGGEGGALICFNDLGQAGAPTEGIDLGTAGAGSALHVSYTCGAILNGLSPSYDHVTGNVTLDVGPLGASAIAGGTFTARYSYYQGGEVYTEECVDGAVSVSGDVLTLPVEAPVTGPNPATEVWMTALALHDQCGTEAEFQSQSPTSSDCIYLRFYNLGEGGGQIDCYEGSCYPACGVITLPPPTTNPGL